ncbi:MAG: 16S rRNA (cytidine(1402)-2'-O)-methyltransferase [Defluviitaleaceae bacterium]|nr:16S rRNA (cytidine(1402)-2'-O)-methyltransferase [Defluviitaleaceae bacterium]
MDKGTLYICGTPIGNLEDITIRQLNIFKLVDFIACEDTRHTLKLLNRYEIKAKLISFHEHNYKKKSDEIVRLLLEGKNIALVSDAGMPIISDPGDGIVPRCREEGIKCTTVPGPTALISGFILSGISSEGFIFGGFFPKGSKGQKKEIDRLKHESRASIYYEAPHRLKKTLSFLEKNLGAQHHAAVVREITKVYEESIYDTLGELVEYFDKNEPRGEIVIVLEGVSESIILDVYKDISIKEHMEIYLEKGLDSKDAMKSVAKDRGVSKREIYAILQKDK